MNIPSHCPDPIDLEACFDHSLPEAELAPIRRHVDRCPDCTASLESLRRLEQVCRALAPAEADAQLEERILARWTSVSASPPPTLRSRRLWRVAAAAAVIVAVAMAWILWPDGGPAKPSLIRGQGAQGPLAQEKVEPGDPSPNTPIQEPLEEAVPLSPRERAKALLVAYTADEDVDAFWNRFVDVASEEGSPLRVLKDLAAEEGPAGENALRVFSEREPLQAGRVLQRAFESAHHRPLALELCTVLDPARARKLIAHALTLPELQEDAIRQAGILADAHLLPDLAEVALERPELGDVIRQALQSIPGRESLELIVELHRQGATNGLPALFARGAEANDLLRDRVEPGSLSQASLELELLARLGDRGVVPLLKGRLRRGQLPLSERELIGSALARVGGFEAARTLVELVRSDAPGGSISLREEWLREFDADEAAGLIAQASASANPFERSALLEMAARIGGEAVVGELSELALGRDRRLTALAIRALGLVDHSSALVPLASLLTVPREDVRSAAIRAIGRLGDSAGAALLVERLRRENRGLRAELVDALAALPDDAVALPALIRALGFRDVAARAHQYLQERTGQALPARPRAWESWLQDRTEAGSAPAVKETPDQK